MRKPTINSMVKKMERYKADLAKTRDLLRDLESEVSGLAESADQAVDDLSSAIDALSELV